MASDLLEESKPHKGQSFVFLGRLASARLNQDQEIMVVIEIGRQPDHAQIR